MEEGGPRGAALSLFLSIHGSAAEDKLPSMDSPLTYTYQTYFD